MRVEVQARQNRQVRLQGHSARLDRRPTRLRHNHNVHSAPTGRVHLRLTANSRNVQGLWQRCCGSLSDERDSCDQQQRTAGCASWSWRVAVGMWRPGQGMWSGVGLGRPGW